MGPTEKLFQRVEKEKSANEGSGPVYGGQAQRGEKEKNANDGSGKTYSGQFHKGEREKSTAANVSQGYDPHYPGYTSQTVSGSGTPYTPETERVSPPPRQPPVPPRHTLDLTALVAAALEDVAQGSRTCEEDILFDDAVRTPCPPGTEDDVEMKSPGDIDKLEAAKRFLDEDDAL